MRLVFMGLALAVLVVGCGGGESASEAVENLVEAFSGSDYAAAYDMLHPAHQAVVSADMFVECGQQAELSRIARVDEFDITSEMERTRDIPELGERDVTVVSVNLTQDSQIHPRTWDVIKDDGEWRWLLDGETLDNYRAGRCANDAASARP